MLGPKEAVALGLLARGFRRVKVPVLLGFTLAAFRTSFLNRDTKRSLGQASPRASSTRCFQTIANPRTATQPARTSQWLSARV